MDDFFHPLRLGTVKPRPARGDPDRSDRDGRPQGDRHDTWRESFSLELREEYEEHAEASVFEQLRAGSLPSRGVALILGEPGAGKTSLLEEWHRRWWTAPGPIGLGLHLPVLIRLKLVAADWLNGAPDAVADRLWNELGQSTTQVVVKGTDASWLLTLSARLWNPVWLLDGLVEGPVPIGDELLWERLAALPGMVLATCRTAVFQPARPEARRHVAREYRVLPLKPDEQLKFLANALAAKRRDPVIADALVRRLNAKAALRPLATVPLMLRLVAEVGEPLTLPNDRAGFYERASRELWYRRLQTRGDLMALNRDRDRALASVAKEVGLEKLEISSENLDAAGIVGPLKEALKISGLLLFDDRREYASFRHLTFQEYHLARSWEGGDFTEILNEHWADPRYEEALALLVAMRWRAEPVEAVLRAFADGWRARHAKDRTELWRTRRSPFVVVMSLLTRAGVAATKPLMGAEAASVAFRINLAVRRTTPPQTLARLAEDSDRYVRWLVALNSATPPETLARYAEDPEANVRRKVAANSATPPETLARLAEDSEVAVRQGVALNSATPPETFARLAEDPVDFLRMRVAANSATPPETLARLAEDPVDFLRMRVAANSATPPETLARLAEYPVDFLRRRVADNSATPPETLARLAEDPDAFLRMRVAENSATPPETLARLAKDPEVAVRRNVAANNATLPEDL